LKKTQKKRNHPDLERGGGGRERRRNSDEEAEKKRESGGTTSWLHRTITFQKDRKLKGRSGGSWSEQIGEIKRRKRDS